LPDDQWQRKIFRLFNIDTNFNAQSRNHQSMFFSKNPALAKVQAVLLLCGRR
jgi:hypothetical protein